MKGKSTGQGKAKPLPRAGELLERTFAVLRDAVFITDADTVRILECNPAATTIFGYSREEMVGRTTTFLHQDEAALEEFRGHLYPAVERDGFLFLPDFRMRRKDGTVFPTEYSVLPLVDDAGRRVAWVSIVRDITARKPAEEALEAERRRLFAVLETLPAYVWLLARDYSIQFANRQFREVFGEAAGRPCYEVFARGRRPCRVCPPLRVFETHAPQVWERTSDAGRTYIIQDTLLGASDGPEMVLEVGLDITERKRAEEALRESEARYRQLADSIADVFFAMDKDLRYTFWNKASEQLTGIPAAEAIGKSLYELFPHVKGTAADEVYQEVLRTRQPRRSVNRYRLGEKEYLFDISAYPSSRGVSVFVKDVTQEKRAEEGLRKLNQFLEVVVDSANVWLDVLDERANVLIWNKAAELISGYPREEVVGHRRVWKWLYPDGGYRRQVAREAAAVIDKDEAVQEFQTTIRTKADEERVVSWHVRRLTDAQGLSIGSVALGRDVTREVELEEQLRQTAKMEAIGQLAGGIAHDFNNLLAGILGYATLIRQEARRESPTWEAAQTIQETAQRAASLAQQLLGFARRGKYQNVPIDLHRTVEDVIRLLSHTIDRRITITQALAAERAVVLGDPGQMAQVFLNLAVNARDAMPQGGELTFASEVADLPADDPRKNVEAPPGRYLVLSVADTGVGIPKAMQGRIFEPFFTTKERGTGTGMGLATVYGVVTNHGGWVRVDSEPGRGATFRVYLPLAEEAALAAAAAAPVAAPAVTGRILVVDDEAVLRDVLTRMLQLLGHTVLTAADGREAVEVYAQSHREIDLVVIDLIMPRMDGAQCFRALKEIDREVRAVISTGYGAEGTGEELLGEGALGFLQKPYRLADLAETVTRALRK